MRKTICTIPEYSMLSRVYIANKKVLNQLSLDIVDIDAHAGCDIHGINDVGNRIERVWIVSMQTKIIGYYIIIRC